MSPETTSNKIAELHSLRSQVTRWRLGIPLAVIAIITGCILMIYSSVESLATPGAAQEEFVDNVKNGMEDRVVPIVKRAAYQTFHDTKNAVQDELEKLSDRTPEFAGLLRSEVEALVENVPSRTETELSEILADTLAKQDGKISELFPDAEEDRVAEIVSQLTAMAKDQADHVSDKLFEPHLVTINNIIEDLNVIRKSESIRPGDTLASWEMALLVFDVLRNEFSEVHPAPNEDAEKPATAADKAEPAEDVIPADKKEPADEKKDSTASENKPADKN